jgi:two-component system sensor histidine kinase DesK
VVPRVGQPGRHKWAFSAIWLVYLVGPLVQAAGMDKPVAWKVAVYVLVGAFSAVYIALSVFSFQRLGPQSVVRGSIPGVAALMAMALGGCLFLHPHLIGLWVYVGSGAGLALPLERHIAQRMVFLAVLGVTLCAWTGHLSMSDWLSVMFPTFFAGLATIGIRQMATLIAELREAQQQVAGFAANEERLRLARDLHDLTGHSLSMITLKAQLAQRMLDRAPQSREVAAALKEVGEIEEASRQSLTDIREAVSGYRRPTLSVELNSACAALNAAGIELDADPALREASGRHDPETEAVLAWCLREGVTNVIRHSRATRVRVRLTEQGGELVLSVQNNGRGLAATAGGTDTVGGNGLAGLRERLDAVDGRITIGGGDGDFRMVAAVPLSADKRAV